MIALIWSMFTTLASVGLCCFGAWYAIQGRINEAILMFVCSLVLTLAEVGRAVRSRQ